MKDLSEILHKHQRNNNLTQHQMANLLGVSQATYNNWLNRDKEINPKYLPIIAEVCSIELTTLIPHDANISVTSKKYNYQAEVNALELYKRFIDNLEEQNKQLKKEIIRLETELEKTKTSKRLKDLGGLDI